MRHKILILEDDRLFIETMQDFLEEENFVVDLAYNGEEALNKSFNNKYDLYLLDVNVPYINGFDFLRELREAGDKTPAIFITSLNDKASLSTGFNSGCDDFLKKPVDLDELLFRIKAIIARYKPQIKTIQLDENTLFDFANLQLLRENSNLNLAPKEAMLLKLLLQNRDKIVNKEMIEEYLWNPSENISEGSIRVYINNLKKIIGKDKIKNIRGVGYKFE